SVGHVLSGGRDADRGHDMPVDGPNRRGDAADLILVLLKVEGVALLGVAAHPLQPDRARGGVEFGPFGRVEVAPFRLALVQNQRLAQSGGGDGVTLAEARTDIHAATTGDL